MKKLLTSLFGSANERYIKDARAKVAQINNLEAKYEAMSEEELKGQTGVLRQRLEQGASLDDLLFDSFAVTREAGKRALGMRHYDVQMIGAMVMHEGKIAEMKTGEGKTLVATLALYLNALEGKGAHLITVNDYLAQRDAAWMGKLYSYMGMSVGTIISDMSDAARKRAYAADITYGTNNEFGFDYLRDNMKFRLEDYVQRPLRFAIVDEVDSILIDEARTPLIISGKANMSTEMYFEINKIVPYLKRDEDYLVDEEHRSATLTDSGVEKVEERLGIDNLYDPVHIETVHHVNKALQAHTLYKKGEQYIVEDGEVKIVDEFTGRKMEGRRWSDGLHQAVEAKEGVEIKDENQTLATVTFQNYFRMYDKLSGMTGTAETEAEEFHEIYKLDCVVIPTNRPIQRIDQEDVIYRSYREKFNAIVEQIVECNKRDQPVLVGTTSVEKSEALSQVLNRKGIKHEVLNAKYHEREAEIVAQAGRKGRVTIATNMAGRGTDILLGGNPEAMADDLVGEPDVPEFTPENEREQYFSEEYKAALNRFKEQCAKEKQEVLDNGGLFIIGTERHESRRIDNQLRGRAGRQGDPGESRFFLSLDDDLLRLFGAERIGKIMDTLKMEEGVPIEHRMVTRSIENAQKKVEGRNFDIRKNVLEYDDVMDTQRKTIYTMRRNVLQGHDEDGRGLLSMSLDLFEEVALSTIDTYASRQVRHDDWDLAGLSMAIEQVFDLEISFDDITGRDAIEARVWSRIEEMISKKEAMLDEVAAKVNERRAQQREQQSAAAAADGADWDEPEVEEVTGRQLFEEQIQNRYLRAIDRYWRQHLQAMEQLRDGIGMRGYAQKDPKQEYKKEGYNLFVDLMMNIKTNVVEFVSKFEVEQPESLQQRQAPAPQVPGKIVFNRPGVSAESEDDNSTVKRELPQVGRNDPCPCGSGKKYKSCCMRKEAAAS
ncbi:preprotein translocase subunit SecA [Lujinxingia vulgaris]|uniref:Protein translocase subunit SecA n=1 Tax=Lujinxingia vulgaris TaxID=2600176 RepID=A0A5C6XKI4_9DELT|nr:preprotein translocase subunit SecA [Lujinxingia vulgaris]TXD41285.1 preprotein translocase subunit SecA [Lujinxingia vulgaris]